MSTYYKQEFVSPGPLFAEVKEDLKSYFASGAIDDVMFPKWTEHCLKRFRKSAFKITETVLEVCDYQACLPEDFNSVREAWMCSLHTSTPIPDASARYYQKDCRIESYSDSSCDECFAPDSCCDLTYMVTHKVTSETIFQFTRTHLLRPGNMNAKKQCGDNCKNIYASGPDSFDIVNGKLITNFVEGTVHLLYYAEAFEEGEQLVPDNFWVQDYIRKFLTYKCFVQLSNIVTDETFNQVERKLERAKQEQAEAFILAETELKKQTVDQKIRQIGKSYRINNKYRLP